MIAEDNACEGAADQPDMLSTSASQPRENIRTRRKFGIEIGTEDEF